MQSCCFSVCIKATTYPSALGPVTEVKTDIFVTSFGPVSDVEMVRATMPTVENTPTGCRDKLTIACHTHAESFKTLLLVKRIRCAPVCGHKKGTCAVFPVTICL